MKDHPQPLDPWIEGYLAYLLNVSRKTRNTVKDVRCSLNRISRKMQKIHPGESLWKLPLRAYLRWLEEEREGETSSQSLAKYISHVRGLLDYAWRSGRAECNVLDGFQLQDAVRPEKPRCLTMEEARQLVEACPNRSTEARRNRVMILLLYGCGLRTNELCMLRIQDIDRERQELFVVRGKGDRQRHVPIPDGVYVELLAYLLERGGKRGPLFRTMHKHRPISHKDVGQVVRQASEWAGLGTDITPKALRHSFATHLMDRGVDLAVIASLMGHSSPHETGVYLHVLGDKSERAVERLDLSKQEGDVP